MTLAIVLLMQELRKYKDTIKEMQMEREKTHDESEKLILNVKLNNLMYAFKELEKAIKYLERYKK